MNADFDIYQGTSRIQQMEASPIRIILDRAATLRAEGKHVIPFSAGEPNFNTPETIKQATMKAIDDNYTHYGSNRGTLKLREIIANNILKETGVMYHPESEVMITSSGAEAINNVILTFIEEGDEVIVFTPAFVSYKNLVKFAGGKLIDIPLNAECGFQPDPKEVLRKVTNRTKMIILNNPNNPTGAVYHKDVLEELALIAVHNNILVLSDEMYSKLVYGETQFVSMASFPGMKERSVIVNGFSKTYAMTGWRLGYVATDHRLGQPLLKMHQYSTTCSPTFIQQGLIHSLELPETKQAVNEMIVAFSKRRMLMLQGLDKIKDLSYIKPEGAFYVMVDVSKTGLDGIDFAKRLLDDKFVATVPAIGLGDTCGNYIRISYAASDDDIVEGLKRMSEFVESIQAK